MWLLVMRGGGGGSDDSEREIQLVKGLHSSNSVVAGYAWRGGSDDSYRKYSTQDRLDVPVYWS